MPTKKMSDETLVKDIIKRYGEVINLKKTPHLILEIIRTHGGGIVQVPDAGVSVAGVGTPPSPGPSKMPSDVWGSVVDNAQLMKEILQLSKQVSLLSAKINSMGK